MRCRTDQRPTSVRLKSAVTSALLTWDHLVIWAQDNPVRLEAGRNDCLHEMTEHLRKMDKCAYMTENTKTVTLAV